MPVNPVPTLGWRRETVAATILQVTQDQRDQMALRTRKLMEAGHFTNVSLARKAEVAEKTVSRLINAKREPRYDTIERVATALGVSAQELMGTPPAPLGLGRSMNGLSQLDRVEHELAAIKRVADELKEAQFEQAVREMEAQKQLAALEMAIRRLQPPPQQ